jgi:hypothetical protein
MHLPCLPNRLDALGQVHAPAALLKSTKAGLEDVSDAGARVPAFEAPQFMPPQQLPALSAAEVVAGTGAAPCIFTHERDDAVLVALKRQLDVWPDHIQVLPPSGPSGSTDLVSAVLGSVMQAVDSDGEKSQPNDEQCEPMACMPACIAEEPPLLPDGTARLSLAAQLTSAAVEMCGGHVTPPALSPEFAADAADVERLAANADPHERACAVLRHMNGPDDDTDAVGDAPQKAVDILQLTATPDGTSGIDILMLEPPAPDGLLLSGGTAAVCADTVAGLLALARHDPSAHVATRAASTSALAELAAPQLWHTLVVAPTIAMPDTEVATLRVPSVPNPPGPCVAATLRAAATAQGPAAVTAALELAMRWGRDMAPARTPAAQTARKLATTPAVVPMEPMVEAPGATSLLEFGEDSDITMGDGNDAPAALPARPSSDKPAPPPAATGTPVTPAAPLAAVAPASKKAAAVKLKLRPGQVVTIESGASEKPKVFGARTSVESELAFLTKAMGPHRKEAPGVRVLATELELQPVPHIACWRALRAAARDVAHAHVEPHSSDDAALVLDDNWGGSGAPNLDALQSRLRQLIAVHGDGPDARSGVSHVAAVACCYTLAAAASALLHCGLQVGAAYLTHALRCVPALDSAPLSDFTRGVAMELTAAAEMVMAKPDEDHPKLTALRRCLQVCDALAPGAKAAVIADGRAMFTLAHVVVAAGLRVHQLNRDSGAAAAGSALPARVAEAARMCDVLLLTYDQLDACVPALVACGVANVVLYTPSPTDGSAPHAVSALLPGFSGTVHVFSMRVPSDSPPADVMQHEAAPEPMPTIMDLLQPPGAPAPALHAPDRIADTASQHCRLVVALNARASIWSELPALRDGVLRLEGKCAASVAERHMGDMAPHGGGGSMDMRPLHAVLSSPDALALGACRRVTALRIMRRSDEVGGLASMTTLHPARLAAGLAAWSAMYPGSLILVITLPSNDQLAARIGAGVACLAGASAAAGVRLRLCMVATDADAKDAVLWELTALSGITAAAPPSAAFELAPPHLVPLPERASPGELVLCACPGISPLTAHALLSSGISLSALLRQDVVPHATALVDAAARGGCVMPEQVADSLHVWRTAVVTGPPPMPPSAAAPPATLYAPPPPIVHAAPNYGHTAGPWAEAPPVMQQDMYARNQPQHPAQQEMYEHCQQQRPAPEVRTEFEDDPEMRALFEEPGPHMSQQQLLHPPPQHQSRHGAGGIGIGSVRMPLPPLGVSGMHGNSFMGGPERGGSQWMHPPINGRSTASTSSLSDETARFLADMDGGAPGGQRPSAMLLGSQQRGPLLVRPTAPPPRPLGGSGRGTALEAHRFNRPDAAPVQPTKRARLGDTTIPRSHSPDSSGSAFHIQHHPAVSAPSAPLGAGIHPSSAGGATGLRPPQADKQKLSDIMNKLKGTGRRGWRSSKR